MSIALLVEADRSGPLVARIGAWSPPIGISYRIDRFAGMMLVIAMITLLAVLLFAIGEHSRKSASAIFYPVYLVLAAGVCAAFSTGDLFHLFVAFEILLMASYVLLTLDGNEAQVRAGTTYVIINTIESVVLLPAIGLVYAATGTLSMAELPRASRRAELRRRDRALPPAAHRVRPQGGGVPPLLLAARLVPERPQPGHRGVRRAAHQGRRLRDRAHAGAAVPRFERHAAPVRRRDHDGRRCARRDRPERDQADPLVPHRQPDRLHDLRHRHRWSRRRSRRRSSSSSTRSR